MQVLYFKVLNLNTGSTREVKTTAEEWMKMNYQQRSELLEEAVTPFLPENS